MALGILGIIYVVLIAIAIIAQFLLYKDKNERKNNIYIINMLLGIILSFIAFTSLPTNFASQRILAIALGFMALIAVGIKLKTVTNIIVSKVMLSISIIGSLLMLFL